MRNVECKVNTVDKVIRTNHLLRRVFALISEFLKIGLGRDSSLFSGAILSCIRCTQRRVPAQYLIFKLLDSVPESRLRSNNYEIFRRNHI
jgi:hypothetical protein